ncbi:uncharacterized protein [Primulina eburnea]|uniref:uncharacterized protein n=1 Tax=Primulina eburnea TaxID=1245227 RepID=UPI003C6C49B6
MITNTHLGIVHCDPAYEIKYSQESIKSKYGYDISYTKAWKSLKYVVDIVNGKWESSISLLPKYMGALSKYNLGTIIELKHLRTVDGTHIYTKYKQKLFTALTLDANNQVLPLVFALVDEENYDSWRWFHGNVARHFTRGCRDVCVISDRHSV